ncbi:MAG: ATP-dependent helicase [Parasporobacterium sp.]|nr:ATP-dependent helicase [Parasporobacterium sp.]
MNFNHAQLQAIRHGDGPLLISAGPGSGKTAVIVQRVRHLIRTGLCAPENILILTFTRAAAREMADRYRELRRESGDDPVFGTFHSIFRQILQKEAGLNRLRIISAEERTELIRQELRRLGMETDDLTELTAQISNEISRLKNCPENETPVQQSGLPPADSVPEDLRQIFRAYTRRMQQEGLMDFDDILLQALERFRSDPWVLRRWQHSFRYLLVDEFQDLNRIQYESLKLLAAPENNLCVVGDEDQSIYGFRGSTPDIFRRFEADYPNCARIFLNINYRCAARILETASGLFRNDPSRSRPGILAGTDYPDSRVLLTSYADRDLQYRFVAELIRQYLESGIPGREIAILFRNRRDLVSAAGMLSENGISCSTDDPDHALSGHFITKDLLAYFRMASGTCSREDLLRILNRPARFLPRYAVPAAKDGTPSDAFLESLQQSVKEDPDLSFRVRLLLEQLRFLSRMTSFAGIEYLLHAVGYRQFLEQRAREKGLDMASFERILETLKKSARVLPSREAFCRRWDGTGQKTAPEDLLSGQVRLLTMHASKGLEFEAVFLPDLNKGVIPASSADPARQEEERRLLYVAMTRARRFLHLSCTQHVYGKQSPPSPFFRELAQILPITELS